MNREQRKDLVLKCLLANDKNKHLHQHKMYYHLNSSDSNQIYTAPVNPKYLEVDHTPIVMSEDVFDAITTIDEYNLNKKKEVPFVIYGKKTRGGAIFLDDLYCNFDKLKESSATLDKLEDFLFARLNVFLQDKMKGQVIVLGHTHPFNGRISFNYSIADLTLHLFYYEYNVFCDSKYKNLLLSFVKTVSQDYNFIMYDDKAKVFKVFDKVYIKTKRGYTPLSAIKFCDD